jgi:precorrin-6Y C5,15-methyltransferase (decarboxylating)
VRPPVPSRVTVVGIGADGWSGVPKHLRTLLTDADVVFGGERHLALLPPVEGQFREPWPSPLREGLPDLFKRYAYREVVALASGDPLVSGIGSTLVELLGAETVQIEPALSSVALARARMGWAAESTAVVSVVGRDPRVVLREFAPGRRVIVLSADAGTPEALAGLLVLTGYGRSVMTVLGDLGSKQESRAESVAQDWSGRAPALNVVALELAGPRLGSWATGLPDEVFESDGQLTRRDLRASALARLAPQPGELLWDVGAGAGSIGIEWMLADPSCRAIAVEADEERAARIHRNAGALGVPALEVVTGRAPEALTSLAKPDAVFVGGGATVPGLVGYCMSALRPGGRLVAHGVTLETETLLARLYEMHGGELTRISVEHAEPLGSFSGWTPARAVTQWAYAKDRA